MVMGMGNFLVTIRTADGREVPRVFQSGLRIAQSLKLGTPSKIQETEWVSAASFPRINGSGTPIVFDRETGSWLLAAGTWFHAAGYGSGAESTLLERYLTAGPLRLSREIDGFFVVVIGDARTREIVVITDLVGSCHCFIRKSRLAIHLSGSSLLLAGLEEFSLDPVGCQEFLRTGVIYENRTVYKEVQKLGPASIFRFAQGSLKASDRYWSVTDLTAESIEIETAAGTLWDSLIEAARKVGNVFARPVCDLTGGYDSRALVAAFLGSGVRFSAAVSGPADSGDVIVSSGLAQLAGLPHIHFPPGEPLSFAEVTAALPLTDGEYNLVEYAHVMRIHRDLMQRFDISINGSFGEVARGYWWELLFPRTGQRSRLDAKKVARLRYGAEDNIGFLFVPQVRLDLASHFADVIERTNAGLSELPNTIQMDHAYLMMRMQRWQGRIATSTNRIWPCLSPFLFRSVLETMLQTKARFRQRSLLIRKMLAEFQPRFANFPLEYGYPAVPANLRNIFRFWPLVDYYAKKLASKAVRMAGVPHRKATNAALALPPRLQLWTSKEVQELLQPATMNLATLLDVAALRDFLAKSRERNFRFEGEWARLMSLEYTLQALKRVKETDATAPINATD